MCTSFNSKQGNPTQPIAYLSNDIVFQMYKQLASALLLLGLLGTHCVNAVTCGGFPPAKLEHCVVLMNRYLGDVSVSPIRNGYAVIEFATCAITTRPASGQVPVTNDYLARRGKSTSNDCESTSISGSIPDPRWPRVCMLNTDALDWC
ncbi:uncharacterized protein LACBIDRAFT_314045 [Laccaria bicolor S238N-H82]|uniref:Predicted protein n=1 Tax=Laccaria bicolor (strain S238N-H82 / ATCC MYA-4686) TaxID=486041 RepID=B0D1G1_LACBS|nr:uncharacterized protein LACBIDRAFT_314045 [Laccaria bicolor S238N-H82]EDR11629.1 predicted protein [Laccaria bicolor S238N-H82]|eukprot:XP_001877526.1 predicted protein [Laccaria bicolor S238N-H82]